MHLPPGRAVSRVHLPVLELSQQGAFTANAPLLASISLTHGDLADIAPSSLALNALSVWCRKRTLGITESQWVPGPGSREGLPPGAQSASGPWDLIPGRVSSGSTESQWAPGLGSREGSLPGTTQSHWIPGPGSREGYLPGTTWRRWAAVSGYREESFRPLC